MRKVCFVIFVLAYMCSCTNKSLLYDSKENYITIDNTRYVAVYYKQMKYVNSPSNYQIKIVNTNYKNMNVFSTVLENSLMFNSEENKILKGKKISYDSYYPNYMGNAVHSGEKFFNFITILPGDTLTININEKLISNIEELELKYYYFISNDKNSLLDIENTRIVESKEYISL